MNTSINAVGFTLEQKQSDMVDSKLKRISYADDLIVDLIIKIKHDKEYVLDANVNFKWGTQAHVSGEDYDFSAALDVCDGPNAAHANTRINVITIFKTFFENIILN